MKKKMDEIFRCKLYIHVWASIGGPSSVSVAVVGGDVLSVVGGGVSSFAIKWLKN